MAVGIGLIDIIAAVGIEVHLLEKVDIRILARQLTEDAVHVVAHNLGSLSGRTMVPPSMKKS